MESLVKVTTNSTFNFLSCVTFFFVPNFPVPVTASTIVVISLHLPASGKKRFRILSAFGFEEESLWLPEWRLLSHWVCEFRQLYNFRSEHCERWFVHFGILLLCLVSYLYTSVFISFSGATLISIFQRCWHRPGAAGTMRRQITNLQSVFATTLSLDYL